MAIFKVNKTKDYSVISNHHLREKNMSLKAKGLLSIMLSLPENWDYSISGLVSICKENETAINSTLKELKDFGYVRIDRLLPNQTKTGRIEYIYNIFETPLLNQKQEGEKQALENQPLEFLPLENQGQLNTNNIYNTLSSYEIVNTTDNINTFDTESEKVEIIDSEERVGMVQDTTPIHSKNSSLNIFSKTTKKDDTEDLKNKISTTSLFSKKQNTSNPPTPLAKKHASITNSLKLEVSKMNEPDEIKQLLYTWLDVLEQNKKQTTKEQMAYAIEMLDRDIKDIDVKKEAIKLATIRAHRDFSWVKDEAKKNLNKVIDCMHTGSKTPVVTEEELLKRQEKRFKELGLDKMKVPEYF